MKETIDLPKSIFKNIGVNHLLFTSTVFNQLEKKNILKSLFCTEFMKFLEIFTVLLSVANPGAAYGI